jgi:phosphoglycolate phosphatase-like HAD superfamily hydrolase
VSSVVTHPKAKMDLLIFDVDGTLTRTLEVDSDCFTRAFKAVFGWTGINTDWASYPNYTDSGIAREIFLQRLSRPPRREENRSLIVAFLRLLEDAWRAAPSQFTAVAGAARLIRELQKNRDHATAVATGCWAASARFKLDKAGIDLGRIPLTASDRILVREEIVRRAVEKTWKRFQAREFRKVVFIGDGVWDVKVARRLGLAFIGVGDKDKQKLLRAAGARSAIEDFSEYDFFLQEVERAAIPL